MQREVKRKKVQKEEAEVAEESKEVKESNIVSVYDNESILCDDLKFNYMWSFLEVKDHSQLSLTSKQLYRDGFVYSTKYTEEYIPYSTVVDWALSPFPIQKNLLLQKIPYVSCDDSPLIPLYKSRIQNITSFFPHGVKRLKMEKEYKFAFVYADMFPDSVEVIIFVDESIYDARIEVLPKNIKELHFGLKSKFKQPFRPGFLPSSLKVLHLPKYYHTDICNRHLFEGNWTRSLVHECPCHLELGDES